MNLHLGIAAGVDSVNQQDRWRNRNFVHGDQVRIKTRRQFHFAGIVGCEFRNRNSPEGGNLLWNLLVLTFDFLEDLKIAGGKASYGMALMIFSDYFDTHHAACGFESNGRLVLSGS